MKLVGARVLIKIVVKEFWCKGIKSQKKPGSSFLEFLAQVKQTVQSTILKYRCHVLSQAGDEVTVVSRHGKGWSLIMSVVVSSMSIMYKDTVAVL